MKTTDKPTQSKYPPIGVQIRNGLISSALVLLILFWTLDSDGCSSSDETPIADISVTAPDGNVCVMQGDVPRAMYDHISPVANRAIEQYTTLSLHLRRPYAEFVLTKSLDAKTWLLNLSRMFARTSEHPSGQVDVYYNSLHLATAKRSTFGDMVVEYHD